MERKRKETIQGVDRKLFIRIFSPAFSIIALIHILDFLNRSGAALNFMKEEGWSFWGDLNPDIINRFFINKALTVSEIETLRTIYFIFFGLFSSVIAASLILELFNWQTGFLEGVDSEVQHQSNETGAENFEGNSIQPKRLVEKPLGIIVDDDDLETILKASEVSS